jgi:hypothetical protein
MTYPLILGSLPEGFSTQGMLMLKESPRLLKRLEMVLIYVSNLVLTAAKNNTMVEQDSVNDLGETIKILVPAPGNIPPEVVLLAKECGGSESKRQVNAQKMLSYGLATGVISSEEVSDSVLVGLAIAVVNDLNYLRAAL